MIAKIIIAIIRFYQTYLSFLFGQGKCRFNPTCSSYCIEVIRKKGVVKGVFLASYRILRCNPFCEGGDDFVK